MGAKTTKTNITNNKVGRLENRIKRTSKHKRCIRATKDKVTLAKPITSLNIRSAR